LLALRQVHALGVVLLAALLHHDVGSHGAGAGGIEKGEHCGSPRAVCNWGLLFCTREAGLSEIVLETVTKRCGAVKAVDGVSFRAEKGRFVVLLGPSGCGKSTLLRLVARLEEVSEGRTLIEGRDVTKLDPTRRRLSMVFQSYVLFPHLSVAENIVFGLKVRNTPAAERAERLGQVAELVGLSGRLEHKPQQLSGGQRQRVALARAIVSQNPICLMDEPLSNLDAQLRHEMRVEIRALQRRLGMT